MRETMKIQAEGFEFTLVPRDVDDRRAWSKTTRVYVGDDCNFLAADAYKLVELEAAEAALGERQCSTKGEFPEVDTLYKRLNRMVGRVKVQAAKELVRILSAALELENVRMPHTTQKFSRYAGCSCPCSPGVILVPGSPTRVVASISTSARPARPSSP
jgi:hypothetical protein